MLKFSFTTCLLRMILSPSVHKNFPVVIFKVELLVTPFLVSPLSKKVLISLSACNTFTRQDLLLEISFSVKENTVPFSLVYLSDKEPSLILTAPKFTFQVCECPNPIIVYLSSYTLTPLHWLSLISYTELCSPSLPHHITGIATLVQTVYHPKQTQERFIFAEL